MSYTLPQLTLYLLLYSFLGWLGETVYVAVKNHCFVNRGLLNLPLIPSYGIIAVLLTVALPGLPNLLLQYIMCVIVMRSVQLLSEQFMRSVSGSRRAAVSYTHDLPRFLRWALYALLAALLLMIYLVVHPLLHTVVSLLPDLLVTVIAVIGAVCLIADFIGVVHTLRTGHISAGAEQRMASTAHLSSRITLSIRDRLNTVYPGIMTPDPSDDGDHTFARGLCFDKLVWVFLVSAFLGALIEMCYCYSIDGYWMNRSSLLYGPFSVVWGAGAVVLTVTLHGVANKADRWIFLAGFFIGGAYEYLCSVFTELVFGTVFWDYSNMPLNIGGRTNVMYCIFWGILAVVWVKVLYPKLSDLIQCIPPLHGKLLTWALVLVMGCNCIMTAAAMIRYDLRQTDPTAHTVIDTFIDERYDDAWMEHRWPNMKQSG